MMPHFHLILGITGGIILEKWGVISVAYFVWLILGSVAPDLDIFFSFLIKDQNHRRLPTHFPLPYLVGIFVFGFLGYPSFCWFFLGALLHVIIDVGDWGIFLFAPFSMNSYSLINLSYEELTKGKTVWKFIQNYYQNSLIVILEIANCILCLCVVLIL
ncbi:MAG: metal-dependent hydrolase [Candidatus Heimdallarchaeota archaeon]|nr:MAG: metal-dependent hydrolase [Candidatus Heimdallarchaeota archaeon]